MVSPENDWAIWWNFIPILWFVWKSLSHARLYDPVDYTVHGILQARILEWVAFPWKISRGSSQPRDRTQVSRIAGGFFISWATRSPSDQIRSVTQSCPTLCNTMNRSTPGLPVHYQLPEFTQTHPSSHIILCRPLLLLPPIPPSIRVFSNESTLRMRWPKYWSFTLASFLPKKSQGWSPSEWTGWISLQSKGLSRVFSNTTLQKHQFFGTQLSSQSNSHIHRWPLEKQVRLD